MVSRQITAAEYFNLPPGVQVSTDQMLPIEMPDGTTAHVFKCRKVMTPLEYTTEMLARMGITDPVAAGYERSDMGTWRRAE